MGPSHCRAGFFLFACLVLLAAGPQVRRVEASQPPRKLLQTTSLTHDISYFCGFFNATYNFEVYVGTFFGGRNFYAQFDACATQGPFIAGQPLFPSTISGFVTEEAYSDDVGLGRKITVHLEGGGVTAYVLDFPSYPLFYSITRALGITPALSKEDLQLVIPQATSFQVDLVFIFYGTNPGDSLQIPFNAIDSSFGPLRLVREEISVTIQGPFLGTDPYLLYPPGSIGVFKVHILYTKQNHTVSTADINDINFNLLPPDDNSARAAAIILPYLASQNQTVPTVVPAPTTATPAPTASTPSPTGTTAPTGTPASTSGTPGPTGTAAPTGTPTPTTPSAAPAGTGFPVGGTCDPNSALPNQCFNANGKAYVCCPGGCPSAPGETPQCG